MALLHDLPVFLLIHLVILKITSVIEKMKNQTDKSCEQNVT
jgi:hypothetical protein